MRHTLQLPEPRPGFALWSQGKKIHWFFNERFAPWLVRSVEIEIREKQFYSALYLMVLGIGILSGFYEGRKQGNDTFSSFVRRYCNRILSARIRPPRAARWIATEAAGGENHLCIAELLWAAVRGGFEDTYAPYAGVSITERSHYYVRCYRRIGIRIDIYKLHRDFLRACQTYIDDVCSDYLVRERFVKRFNEICEKAKGGNRTAAVTGGGP